MKSGLFVLILFSWTFLYGQRAILAVENYKYHYETRYFWCGTKLKVKLNNGRKFKAPIDTLFADAMLLQSDTIRFSDIKWISWQNYHQRKDRRRFRVGLAGTAAGLILTGFFIASTYTHDVSAQDAGSIAGSVGIPAILIGIPILIQGYYRTYAWHRHYKWYGWQCRSYLK